MVLRFDETSVAGAWIHVDGRVVGDESERRIQEALRLELTKVADGAWETLYRSTSDGRYWVLDYPQSQLHGGGPKRLTAISPADARARFAIPPDSTEPPNPPKPGPCQ